MSSIREKIISKWKGADHSVKEQLKYSMAIIIHPIFYVFYIFIHECGHLITGSLCGLRFVKFIVTYEYGTVSFGESVLSLPDISRFLIYFSGGLVETIVLLSIANAIWKPYRLWALSSFPYACMEGVRGILLVSASDRVYYGFRSLIDPVCGSFVIVMYLIIVFRLIKLEREQNSMDRAEIYTKLYGL